jgi:hypothetical protein
VDGLDDILITPFAIAGTNVIIEASVVRLFLSGEDAPPIAGLPDGWKGVFIPSAAIHLPGMPVLPETVAFENCSIGSGGFTGEVDVSWEEGDEPAVEFFELTASFAASVWHSARTRSRSSRSSPD